MYKICTSFLAVAPTVVLTVWLPVVFGSGTESPHQQQLLRSYVKWHSTMPPDEAEKVRHVLHDASELCLRSIASPRLELLVEIAVAQSRAGEATESGTLFERALKMASDIKDAQERYHALLTIAVSQAKVGRVNAAIHTAELATSPKHHVGIMSMVAETLSSEGDVRNALIIAKLIPEAYGKEKNVVLCNVALNIADRGACSQAMAILTEVKPDMAHARRLYLRQQAGRELSPDEQAVVSEAVSKAVGLLNVAQCHARAGRFVEATKVAETIGFGRFSDRAFRHIASIAVNAGNLEVARQITLRIRDEKEKALALRAVAVGEAAKGLRDDSMKTVAAITRTQVKTETMMRIAIVLAQSGDNTEAEKVLAAVWKENLDPKSRIATQLKIAKAFAENRHFTAAEKIAERLADQKARARLMAEIGRAYERTGDTANAQKSFQRAYECVMHISDPYERTKVLRGLAASQRAAKDRDGVARTLREATRIAATIPAAGGTNVIALQEIAAAQAKSGDRAAARGTFQFAMNAAKRYKDEEYAARLSQDVVQVQAECGDSHAALEYVNKIESDVIKCRCLLGIALGLLRPGGINGGGSH